MQKQSFKGALRNSHSPCLPKVSKKTFKNCKLRSCKLHSVVDVFWQFSKNALFTLFIPQGDAASWLTTGTRKPKFPGLSPAPRYV